MIMKKILNMKNMNEKKKDELFRMWYVIYQYQCQSIDNDYINKVRNVIAEYVDNKYPVCNIQLRLF